MGDCPTCGRRMDMIVGLVEGPMPEMPDLPPRIEVFKETFYRMRDANDRMRPVFDAAMARHKAKLARNEVPMLCDPMVILEKDRAVGWAEIILDEACRKAEEVERG